MSINLFALSPENAAPSEIMTEILLRPGLKIERIVSAGYASPPGFWYDQSWDEWVGLLSGTARLSFEGEAKDISLGAGDHIFIPAHVRHRVEETSTEPPAIWLAVHVKPVGE